MILTDMLLLKIHTCRLMAVIIASTFILNGCTSVRNVNNDWLADNCSPFPLFYAEACGTYNNCKPVENNNTMCACTFTSGSYLGQIHNGKSHGVGGYDMEDGRSFLGHWMNGDQYCGIESKGQDYWVYKDGQMVKSGNNIANAVVVAIIAGAVYAIAASNGGGGGGGGHAPSDSDWDWDYQPKNGQWACRGIQTGQYAEISKCAGDYKDDDRWPN